MAVKKDGDWGRKICGLADKCSDNGVIDPALFIQHKVNKGLRDPKGKGVLTGLTNISDVIAKKIVNGEEIPCEGQLFYRGYNINELCNDFFYSDRYGFEEITYLLLFGELPTSAELDDFKALLAKYRKSLPNTFVRDIIMKAPSNDMMNSLARSVLTLYSYDEKANDTSLSNVLSQCLQLIALFPLLSVYGYQAYEYYIKENNSFFIHAPKDELSTAENILHMLRIDSNYSKLEAKVLDLALVLHAEHGGGNNSTFTARAVTSSGTDTYSAIAAAIGSLKGPKHGGANIKVSQMFNDIKKNVADWNDDEEIENYLNKILNKECFDKSGLIYGIGHAVYSLSDPRALLLKKSTKSLSEEKGLMRDYNLYAKVEEIAIKLISSQRHIFKGVSANIDFYSGFIYDMLGLPQELYTPIFAIARISGWSAHRMEELINSSRIMRPAYNCTQPALDYVPMKDRK
ncbi:MAG: citrate/2-methylcitrate synthase [Clostridia bacterium]|jgi:citrate synthase|nr:citrate/2-methylcitrate synthase [Clostridia bacterium]MCI8944772.1 citrate/2-methylcitrate synthase [Clostridia bacterium]MCI9290617.1 citrate/2-methylcitrate synthase [Clostridia bacterium]MDE6884812.1 citrate/2-methylcitrate synthase [Clostridia bacterium]